MNSNVFLGVYCLVNHIIQGDFELLGNICINTVALFYLI